MYREESQCPGWRNRLLQEAHVGRYPTVRADAEVLQGGPEYLSYFPHPSDVISRYAFGSGSYPCVITVRTPLVLRSVTMNSFRDVRSLIVCFAKEDYGVELDIRCGVDFRRQHRVERPLFRNPQTLGVQVYLFEPCLRTSRGWGKTL